MKMLLLASFFTPRFYVGIMVQTFFDGLPWRTMFSHLEYTDLPRMPLKRVGTSLFVKA
jgi:hypothetical protein